jgi:hypothetical protein
MILAGSEEGALKRAGLVNIKSQRQAYDDLMTALAKGIAFSCESRVILVSILLNRPEMNIFIEKMPPEDKKEIKKLLIDDWGYVKEFGNKGGLQRIFSEIELAELFENTRIRMIETYAPRIADFIKSRNVRNIRLEAVNRSNADALFDGMIFPNGSPLVLKFRENTRNYLLSWEGGGMPIGAIVEDRIICWAQHGILEACDRRDDSMREMIGTYDWVDRLIGTKPNEHQMVIYLNVECEAGSKTL